MTACTRKRLAGLVAAAALAFGVAACGGGSDDGTKSGGDATTATSADRLTDADSGDTKQQIQAVFDDMLQGMSKADGKLVCSRLTAKGQKVAATLFAVKRGVGCAANITALAQRTIDNGTEQKPTRVLKVTVKGNEAQATVSDAYRKPVKIALLKEDGRWKLVDLRAKSVRVADSGS